MSGGKGTQQTGSATTSQTNPLAPYVKGAADYLTPYAQDPNRPYTAPPNPWQTQGYSDTYGTGQYVSDTLRSAANTPYLDVLGGGASGSSSPAYPGYMAYAGGDTDPQRALTNITNLGMTGNMPNLVQTADYANKAASLGQDYGGTIAGYANRATGGSMGTQELEDVAAGKYTNAASNPYLRDMVNAALRPVSENYQTSTAPTLDARFSTGGRYGSGAADQAAASARDAFARNLGEISTGMYGNEYRFERGQQDTAAANAQAARRADLGLGIQGNTAASDAARQGLQIGGTLLNQLGGVYNQGLSTATDAATRNAAAQAVGLGGLQTGFQNGNQNILEALRQFPQFANSEFIGPQQIAAAGTAQRDLDTSVLREPYDRVNAYLKSISGAGTNAAGTSATQPIFGNPLTSALSGATGVLGLGKELGLGSAASSLFGDAAGLGGTFGGGGTVGAGFGSIGEALAAGLPEAGFGLSEALPVAASAALTIVCTELVRQGRMPNTWRLAGMRQFMRYPAIARRGYWVWATPVVAHLRQKPDSRFSKIIERTFNWRAEDLAAHNGVKGARRLIRGRLVTAAMVLPCLACGLFARRDYFPSGKDAPA